MGLEERQARPHRQDRRHQQGRPQSQGHRRPPAAPETPRAGPGILLRPASALHSRITDSVGLLTHALVREITPSKGVVAMRRLGVIVALSALLGMVGGVATAAPAL